MCLGMQVRFNQCRACVGAWGRYAALTQEEGLLKDDEQAVADLAEKQDQATHLEKASDVQR